MKPNEVTEILFNNGLQHGDVLHLRPIILKELGDNPDELQVVKIAMKYLAAKANTQTPNSQSKHLRKRLPIGKLAGTKKPKSRQVFTRVYEQLKKEGKIKHYKASDSSAS